MNPMDISTFEKLKASSNLPSPKGVALAIMRLTQKEDASMAELARIIKSDPAFVGRLIKAANSVNANPGRPVVSVQEALVVLGMPAVRNLALGFSLLSQYKSGACKGFDYQHFWTASLACGIALQALTLRTRVAQAEEAFSVGLLARVGELALATLYPQEYGGILRTAEKSPGADLTGQESERFALNHRELTVAMLADWGLPRIFCDIVAGHETPEDGRYGEGSREYRLVQSLALARQVSEICIAAEATRPAHLPRLFSLGGRLSIENGDLTLLCDAIVREWREWASILSVSAPVVPSFGELAKAQPAPASATLEAAAAVPARLRVLVVEDERAMRMAVRAMLEEAGYEVIEAADGQEGVRLALEVLPHMVVTDRIMPALDGMELTRMLRETRVGKDMYVLMLTTQGDDGQLVEGFEIGVDDYLPKPLNPRLLIARLKAGERIVRLHQEMEHDRDELRRFAAELAITNRRLQEAALTDVLTGSPNRRYAMERIQQEWAAGARSQRPLACMVIDLDQFKQVNDANGHDVGDAYLKETVATVRGALRAQDVVCRTGGDEFLVICPDTPLQAALACAERIRVAVERAVVPAGSLQLKASLSIGVAVRTEAMVNPDALIKCADQGLYLAKQRGRNRVVSVQNGPIR
jgi:diguanylate cyclase (GGDEF)-like protein